MVARSGAFGPRPAREAVETALREAGDLIVEADATRVAKRSGDFHWFSPILARRLEGAVADAVVSPTTIDELKRLVAACVRHAVPLTVRGGGTGTSGQSVPLRGGVLVDMGYLNRVLAIERGWCRAEAGCVTGVLDAALHERGQALRLHPSARDTATIGGFVAAGAGGVGSIGWGLPGDVGAIRALRVLTVEESPRLLELRGAHVRLAQQGLGTTGILTEVELPTQAAVRWAERVVGFESFAAALRFADALAREDAISKRLVSVVAAPAPGRFLFRRAVDEGTHAVLVMVAEVALEAFETVLSDHPGEALAVASSPLYELGWHHTTWQAIKHDRSLTYLQTAFGPVGLVESILALHGRLDPEEVILHLEFVRSRGGIGCVGLPLVRYDGEERLRDVATLHEAVGASVTDPHALSLETIGRKRLDRHLLAFKHEVDPAHLLNPGKMASVDDPSFLDAAGDEVDGSSPA